jgi:hypothetical protein
MFMHAMFACVTLYICKISSVDALEVNVEYPLIPRRCFVCQTALLAR